MGRDFSPFAHSLDWRPCSAELTPEGQQCTRVPAGSLQLVTVTVTVMVTVTVLPTPRAQPRAARLGTGLECWPCDQLTVIKVFGPPGLHAGQRSALPLCSHTG